ncbi:Peptidyl-prolyl isomerase cwc-27 [Taphrina deformans PYCC 5710]|uniref:Peptidyl-prolyl isomerase CWC27 n=1 Tax=Taphrina deformans (strain PYCC 5710 / ATCC 11124 / CBS 356.35 / IMI 108563 / JCM 9778 / NBRC 8474) TaxID=1097556 RepID=R4X8U7_TAPDE|nr:Peptidyl-prolyl isomerase cwc-27 [Taphrina deformans PYCC 5710]|eukprot:CCG80547.1 Peptidyl-prolyl isomerase cwc-27 [Taphrina deformans PYCC 5710]
MSNLYVTEPPTNGKVLITTNRGEIEIELWSKEAPKASRNFIQLCLEGYYIDTIFHRIVNDFIIQGGDPTATGTGGQSIYDEPFQDEFHSRLKYNRRGLLGMANNGKHDNGSQFFITLASTPELQGKNTLFGRVMGDTIYNVTKMGQSELQADTERPLYPPKVLKTEVLINPFPDIVPRATRAELLKRQEAQQKANRPVSKSGTKNTKLLSFMNDDEEEESAPVVFKSKGKSSHDLLQDERLVSNGSAAVQSRPNARKRKITPIEEQEIVAPPAQITSPITTGPQKKQTDSIEAQIAALTNSLKRKKEAPKEEIKETPRLSYLQEQRLKYAQKALVGGRKKRAAGADEDDTLSALSKFKTKLSAPSAGNGAATRVQEGEQCALHAIPNCQSCRFRSTQGDDDDDDDDDDEGAEEGWYTHQLVCDEDKLGKDESFRIRAEQELEIIDPREKAGQLALRARQEKRAADEKSGRNQYLRRDSRRDRH